MSFKQTATTAWTALTAQECSEVVIVSKTGANDLLIHTDNSNPSAPIDTPNEFLLENDDTFTFRGITNTNQVSAKKSSGTGEFYYRTQFYSSSVEQVW
jgi:hypothetical protein